MQRNKFLDKLAQEAELQAQIQAHTVVPKRFESLASFVGSHTWKVLLILSGLLALVGEIYKWQ